MEQQTMSVRTTPSRQALARLDKCSSDIELTDLSPDFAVPRQRDIYTHISEMWDLIKNNIPALNTGVEDTMEAQIFWDGFEEMAHVVILVVMYCAFHRVEIFNGYDKKPNKEKEEAPCCVTQALATLISK